MILQNCNLRNIQTYNNVTLLLRSLSDSDGSIDYIQAVPYDRRSIR